MIGHMKQNIPQLDRMQFLEFRQISRGENMEIQRSNFIDDIPLFLVLNGNRKIVEKRGDLF